MASPDGERLVGGCFCGAVRFEIAAVFDARYCHCTYCRRTTGAPVAATAVARHEDLRVMAGTLVAVARTTGAEHVCAACRQAVYFVFDASIGRFASIPIGLFDRPEACPPRYHQFFSRRLPWLHVHDTLPKYPEGRVPHPRDRR